MLRNSKLLYIPKYMGLCIIWHEPCRVIIKVGKRIRNIHVSRLFNSTITLRACFTGCGWRYLTDEGIRQIQFFERISLYLLHIRNCECLSCSFSIEAKILMTYFTSCCQRYIRNFCAGWTLYTIGKTGHKVLFFMH